MLSYLREVAICEPIIEMAKRTISESNDMITRSKIVDVPTKESVLRAVSTRTEVNTENDLRVFTVEYVLRALHLPEIRTEQLRLSFLEYIHSEISEE